MQVIMRARLYGRACFVLRVNSIRQKWQPEVWNHGNFSKGGCHYGRRNRKMVQR
jgi:hypothetical protein